MVSALFQESLTIDAIKGIREIYFYKHRGWTIVVTAALLSRRFEAYLSAKWLSDPYLLGKKVCGDLLFVFVTQTLSC